MIVAHRRDWNVIGVHHIAFAHGDDSTCEEALAALLRCEPSVERAPGFVERMYPVGDAYVQTLEPTGEGVVASFIDKRGPALHHVAFSVDAIDAAVASSALALLATPEDAWICCLPLAHAGGLLVLLRGLLLGAPVRVHRAFDPAAVAAETDAAFVSIVPTMLVRLLEHRADLSHLRAILVGGAHLSPTVRGSAERAGGHVIETYGLTESCAGVVYDGRPLPGTEMRINTEGGIELRGPTLMLGYRFDPVGTAAAFTEDGWLKPGDAGEIDAEGRLHVVGRADELINTGGENVWPDEVESALRGHPKIAEIVRRNCAKHGIRYTAQPSLRAALRSHFLHLRTMGRLGMPAEIEMG